MSQIRKLSIVSKILVGQSIVIVFVTAGFFLLGHAFSAKSALYGGFALLLPNIYFALKIHSKSGQEAKKIVQSFYTGESGKLVLTAILFALIFQDPDIDIVALFVTYVSGLTVFWFALFIRTY